MLLQVPITAGAPIPAAGPVEPESLSKEARASTSFITSGSCQNWGSTNMCGGEEHQYVFSPKRADRFPVNQSNSWICVAYTCVTPEIGLAFPQVSRTSATSWIRFGPTQSWSFSVFRYGIRLWSTPQPEPQFGSCQALVSLIKEGQELRRRLSNSVKETIYRYLQSNSTYSM